MGSQMIPLTEGGGQAADESTTADLHYMLHVHAQNFSCGKNVNHHMYNHSTLTNNILSTRGRINIALKGGAEIQHSLNANYAVMQGGRGMQEGTCMKHRRKYQQQQYNNNTNSTNTISMGGHSRKKHVLGPRYHVCLLDMLLVNVAMAIWWFTCLPQEKFTKFRPTLCNIHKNTT